MIGIAARVSKTFTRKSSRNSAIAFHEAARLFEHVIGMGVWKARSQSRAKKSFELHVRRVFGQMFDVSKMRKQAERCKWNGFTDRREQIDAKLATANFDALTLIHNETSTGTMSRSRNRRAQEKISRRHFIVDAVSSMSAVPLI